MIWKGKGNKFDEWQHWEGIPAAKGSPSFGKGIVLSYNVKGGGKSGGKEKGKGMPTGRGGYPQQGKGQ